MESIDKIIFDHETNSISQELSDLDRRVKQVEQRSSRFRVFYVSDVWQDRIITFGKVSAIGVLILASIFFSNLYPIKLKN